jgi:hypothetical protein
MRIDWNGDNVQDDLIFFEPEYQHRVHGARPGPGRSRGGYVGYVGHEPWRLVVEHGLAERGADVRPLLATCTPPHTRVRE